ncbi:MAG TPA: alpha/beta hydrolase [Candidatus Acidoferrales bacterium]|nr:alpha/beta hydrolase [Candidatus Acidoferrales bacterium]
MRALLKVIIISLLSLFALVLLLVGAGLVFRAHRQHQIARALAIHTPNGIDEAMYVRVGGINQWIQIRGQDRNNPVLLCLHGGPGGSWLGLTSLLSPWEKEFTVVQWDQRGTGKTLETTGASVADTMSVARMTQDGIEVSEFLRRHLHKEKILLLGFSWGSLLGVHMVKARSDLFYAYVGTGQTSNMPKGIALSYAYALEKARAAGDAKTVQLLQRIGPPPFDSLEKIGGFFQTLGKYECESDRDLPGGALFAPNLSLWDIYNWIKGFMIVPTFRVYNEMLSADLSSLGPDFQIPIFFFQGALDERTPAPFAKAYFDTIQAPHKEFILFDGAGHFAVWSMADKFLHELVTRVRPFAVPTSPPGS